MQNKEEETKETIKIKKSNWVKTASFLLQESCKLPIDSKMTTMKKLKPRAASSLSKAHLNPSSISYSYLNLNIVNK